MFAVRASHQYVQPYDVIFQVILPWAAGRGLELLSLIVLRIKKIMHDRVQTGGACCVQELVFVWQNVYLN